MQWTRFISLSIGHRILQKTCGHLDTIKGTEILDQLSDCHLLKRMEFHAVNYRMNVVLCRCMWSYGT
jgi:hypothetical protein